MITLGLEDKYDISVTTRGGGINGQMDAIRLGVARALCDISGDRTALTEALGCLVDDAPLRQLMGAHALATIQSGHRWDDYVDRSITFYEGILG